MRALLLIFIGLVFSPLCRGELVPFDHVPRVGEEVSGSFSWVSAARKFELDANGTLRSDGSKNGQSLRLPVPRNWFVESLLVGRFGNDLVLAYQTEFGGDGLSYICRVRGDLDSVHWCQKIPGFNIMVSGSVDSIWVGAMGFIGRLGPKSGKYVWRHGNLYRAYSDHGDSFISVWPAAEAEATVTFESEGTNRDNKRRMLLDRKSGKILRVTDIDSGNVLQ